jgi:hypothetical protein
MKNSELRRLAFNKLQHVKMFENFDQEDKPIMSEKDMSAVKETIKKNSFLSLKDPLVKLGFSVDYVTKPHNMYMIEKSGQRLAILDKKYTSNPDFVHDDIAMSVMENILNEVDATTKRTVEIEEVKKQKVTKQFLAQVTELESLSAEYKALENIMLEMEKKADKIKLLKEQLIPELKRFDTQFMRINNFTIELKKSQKIKAQRTTYAYKEISEALEAMIPVTEVAKKMINDTKEMNKTIHPAEVLDSYDINVKKLAEGAVLDWIKDIFGKVAAPFKKFWDSFVKDLDTLESGLDTLEKFVK